jgi:hypothetical protein
MENELKTIEGNQLIIISLVDECGKETLLGDSFFEHLLKYNSPHLLYVTFDFHEYWCAFSLSLSRLPTDRDASPPLHSLFSKGLQFGNVTTLLELLDEKNLFREMRFSW